MAVAMSALGAVIQIEGPHSSRSIPIQDLHRFPGNTPHVETDLRAGELITAVDLPAPVSMQSHYLKVRDRNSYAFALVSVAVIVDVDPNNRIREARIALGGVAPKPWRLLEAEHVLIGKPANEDSYRQAADILVRGAKTYRYNAFKVELAHCGIVRALSNAVQGG
jgi:xanthine dehydrogenase YagS FAD-binding subunit